MPKLDMTGIYTKKNTAGKTVYFFRAYYPGTRRQHKSKSFKTAGEAIAARRAFLLQPVQGSGKDPSPTFRRMIVETMAWRMKNGGKNSQPPNEETTKGNVRLVTKYCKAILDEPIESVTAEELHRILTRARKSLSVERTRKLKYLINSIFEFSIQVGRCAENPTPELPIRKTKEELAMTKKQHIITRAQLQALIDAARERSTVGETDRQTVAALFFVLYYTGMRRTEAVSLRFSDIEDGVIHLRDQERHGERVPLKNRSSIRDIPLTPDTLAVIEQQRNRYPDDEPYIFGGSKPIAGETLRRALRQAVKDANEAGAEIDPEFSLHDFRHTHASVLLSRGAPAASVSRRLGHGSVKETLTTYAHSIPQDEVDMLDLL